MIRRMEPKEEIPALNIPPRFIAVIKEEPVKRWLTGQEIWDNKYHRQALHVIQQRQKYEKKYAAAIEQARTRGLELVHDQNWPTVFRQRRASVASTLSANSRVSVGEIVDDKRYGKSATGG